MPHTKRTPEFNIRIATARHAVGEMLRQKPEWCAWLEEIGEILAKNTTDSPCFVKAADDEPIFVLRAKDNTADIYINEWATRMLTIAANLTETTGELYDKIRKKAFDAIECAAEFRAYPNRKRPD